MNEIAVYKSLQFMDRFIVKVTLSILVCLSDYNKVLQTGWLNSRFIFHSSGGWKSKIRVPAWSGFARTLFSRLQMALFLYAHVPRQKGGALGFYKALIPFMRASPL